MEIYHLQTFYQVARLMSFTRAAEELSLSQSAVSRHVEALEHEFGMELFVRSGRGAALTEAGTRLMEYAGRLLHVSQEASISLAELRDLESGRLIVGASTTAGHYLLGPVIALYQERYPGIDIRLDVRDSNAIMRLVEEGMVDVAILPELPVSGGIATEPCLSDALLLVAAPHHPLATLPEVHLADLEGVRLFLHESGSHTRWLVEKVLEAKGLTVDKRELGSSEAIKQAVATGRGVGFCSKYAVTLETQSGWLRSLSGPDLPLVRPFMFAYPKGGRRPPAALAFVSLLRKMLPALEAKVASTGPMPDFIVDASEEQS